MHQILGRLASLLCRFVFVGNKLRPKFGLLEIITTMSVIQERTNLQPFSETIDQLSLLSSSQTPDPSLFLLFYIFDSTKTQISTCYFGFFSSNKKH